MLNNVLLQDMLGADERADRGAHAPSMPMACSRLSMSWTRAAHGTSMLSSRTCRIGADSMWFENMICMHKERSMLWIQLLRGNPMIQGSWAQKLRGGKRWVLHLPRHAIQHAAPLNSGHVYRAGSRGQQGQNASSRCKGQHPSTWETQTPVLFSLAVSMPVQHVQRLQQATGIGEALCAGLLCLLHLARCTDASKLHK